MKFAKRVFFSAGIYGLLALLPQYFMEAKVGRDFPPALTHPEYFYGFIGVAVAWQFLFLMIAADPRRLRPVMLPAVMEKVSFGGAAIGLYCQRRIGVPVLVGGVIDLGLAVLFIVAFRRTPQAN